MRQPRRRTSGFTLVEVLTVVVIIGILAAVGFPSYLQYITRSNRQAARAMIYAVADRQEQYFQDNKSYAADLTSLGYQADTIYVGRDGQIASADDDDLIYQLAMGDVDTTTYGIDAEPVGIQAERDVDCGTLSLTSDGQRSASGGGANCW